MVQYGGQTTLFFMEIKIYTSKDCGYCAKMRELLKRVDLEYTEYRIGDNLTHEQFIAIFPNATGYPQMKVDNFAIEGGLTGAVRYFVENGMITSKKPNES